MSCPRLSKRRTLSVRALPGNAKGVRDFQSRGRRNSEGSPFGATDPTVGPIVLARPFIETSQEQRGTDKIRGTL